MSNKSQPVPKEKRLNGKDNIRKQATEWIKKANERNMAEIQEQNAQPEEPVKSTEDDPTRATIRPSTTISSPVHRRAQNNIHRIKPGAGAGILLQSGGRTDNGGHEQPIDHSDC